MNSDRHLPLSLPPAEQPTGEVLVQEALQLRHATMDGVSVGAQLNLRDPRSGGAQLCAQLQLWSC